VELGDDLCEARLACGLTQAEVASALSWSPSRVRRIERGQRGSVTYLELSEFAAVVGLRFGGRLYPGNGRLRDAAQLSMINRYRREAIDAGWSCRIEDPLAISGDLRAFDLMLVADNIRVPHEFISRVRDIQAQVRPILQKQRDVGLKSLIVVIRDTDTNRRALREAGPVLADLFPLSSREVRAAIKERRDPGRNGIVFL
jgi:transcriptional regulator with XRE-family HTH domain